MSPSVVQILSFSARTNFFCSTLESLEFWMKFLLREFPEDPKVGFCRIFDADYDGPRDVGLQRAAGVRITCFRSFWGQK